ncbi:MAG: N-acetylglucosamine-6-phosphate deacetylase [Alphaproteobacteria bacterium]|nr:N-acetylglucosamine-6-phosphate deacetylase [Alphaproteobacteria bacterium]
MSSEHVPANANEVNCSGLILAPGYIDCQVNGGGGVLFNNEPTIQALQTLVKAHTRRGTTRLLPTCTSDSSKVMERALAASRKARAKNASILGIHFEGPHLSEARRGVHAANFLRDMTAEDLGFYLPQDDEIMLLTVAPERVAPEQIDLLRTQGALISLGHTAGKPHEVREALKAGASCFTHLFNGMGGFDARTPGPSGVALDDRNSWCSLIADGHHLSAEALRLAIRAKLVGKAFFVSDAMPPAACEVPASFSLYGEPISVENGQCVTAEGRLAGSSATLADCVRHSILKEEIPSEEALRMASTYPAAFLGLGKKFGKLLPDYVADIVAVNQAFEVQKVWVGGVEQN